MHNCLFKDYIIKAIALMWHNRDEWEFSETVKPPILTNCQSQEVLLHRALAPAKLGRVDTLVIIEVLNNLGVSELIGSCEL